MHFVELVKQSINDFEHEKERLQFLFEKQQVFCASYFGSVTLKRVLADSFQKSRFCGTYTGLNDFLESNEKYWREPTLEGLLIYCELLSNLIDEDRDRLRLAGSIWEIANKISKNIQIIADKTNHEIKQTDEGIIIVRKDALAAVAVEDIADQDVSMAILEYNHNGIQGDLERKKQLLAAIGKHVEPLTQKSGLKNEQPGLVDDVGFCLNNLDIRHNNKTGEKAKPFIQTLSKEELEALYDGAYRSMLLLIEMEAHKEFRLKTKQYR